MSEMEAPAAAATAACQRCGAPTPVGQLGFSEEGLRICPRCESAQTIAAGDSRAAASILGMGLGALALGLVSFCFNPILITSLLAIGSGAGAIATCLRHPEYKKQMGWRYPVTIATAAIGILCALFYPAMLLFGLALTAAR